MWRVYGGAVLAIAGIAVFVEAACAWQAADESSTAREPELHCLRWRSLFDPMEYAVLATRP